MNKCEMMALAAVIWENHCCNNEQWLIIVSHRFLISLTTASVLCPMDNNPIIFLIGYLHTYLSSSKPMHVINSPLCKRIRQWRSDSLFEHKRFQKKTSFYSLKYRSLLPSPRKHYFIEIQTECGHSFTVENWTHGILLQSSKRDDNLRTTHTGYG